ncbi:C-signal-like [Emydura macquarii macquarii]|uniref:C-signal-like n=1 Tax=Emydura macquarii macquarii TaxID=1129001 RepID=UPI00352A384F
MAGLNAHSVLVTGSNRGIGLGLVKHFLGKPDPPEWIFGACRDPEGTRAQEIKNLAAKHPNLVLVPLEVTDAASIKAAAKKVGEHLKGSGLNLLINNAGIGSHTTLDSANPEDMLTVYNTNLIGPMLVTQAFLPLLKKAAQASKQKGMSCSKAAVINISSTLGSIQKVPEMFFLQMIAYRCSKAALNMLTKCQSLGYKEDGILCAALCPGWVKTDATGDEAPLTVDQSVRGILQMLTTLSETHTGTLVNWEGNTVPW